MSSPVVPQQRMKIEDITDGELLSDGGERSFKYGERTWSAL